MIEIPGQKIARFNCAAFRSWIGGNGPLELLINFVRAYTCLLYTSIASALAIARSPVKDKEMATS